jgi:3-dehydroquinate synthase
MQTLTINTTPAYPIYIGENLLNDATLINTVKAFKQRTVLIVDDNLAATLGGKLLDTFKAEDIETDIISMPAGEAYKTRQVKAAIEDQLFEMKCARDTTLVAIGGGMMTDLVGFVAATFCRGVPVIYIPTSLLAMLDASIGGKTGVNTSFGKNLIGAFSQPTAVFMDTSTLDTLPELEYRSGLSEAIKHALITDTPLYNLLQSGADRFNRKDALFLETLLLESCKVKARVVEKDTHEKGLREILNCGHTVAHAIELVSQHAINHGDAVALGILIEAKISVDLGILTPADFKDIQSLFNAYNLPMQQTALRIEKLIDAMLLDKKTRNKKPRFVLLKSIGAVYEAQGSFAHTVDTSIIKKALQCLLP